MKKSVLIGVFSIILVLLATSVALVFEVNEPVELCWIQRYDGPDHLPDDARDIVVDSGGNVFVTGRSYGRSLYGLYYDYATIALDSNGNLLWVQRYDSDWVDEAYAIAVGPEGNVYVTGITNKGSITIAYDSLGNELWRIFNSNIIAEKLAADSGGNVYVTGTGYSGGRAEYATIAYDRFGNELWDRRYNGLFDYDDNPCDIAIDSEGNIYVTGRSWGEYFDIATVAYNSFGSLLWVQRYDGPQHCNDFASAITIDSEGNVYVTGNSEDRGGNRDYLTVAYDSFGNQIWVQNYDGLDTYYDFTTAIAVDAENNVYITGQSRGILTGDDIATIAYDSNGNQLWVQRYDGGSNDLAHAMAVDSEGNVYVTGMSYLTSWDCLTVAYDKLGNELWVESYNGSGNSTDRSNAIVVDSENNVYVAGQSTEIGSMADYVIIKYSQYTPTPAEMIVALIALVEDMNLHQGIDNSLDAKLDAAKQALEDVNENNNVAAISALNAFINAVLAQRGSKISEADADTLIAKAQEIIDMLLTE